MSAASGTNPFLAGLIEKVFLAAYQENKISKSDYLSVDLTECIEAVVRQHSLNLRHLGGAVVGCAKIHAKKAWYLAEDCKSTLGSV